MIYCKECAKIVKKYKSAVLCDSCYNKTLERNRNKQSCIICKYDKICRYSGPTCATCYSKFENPEYGKSILRRNRIRAHLIESKFSRAKTAAKLRKITWALDFDTYKSMVENAKCHYCESNLNNSQGICLDRIDNDKSIGYAQNNVLPCCGPCNRIRGDNLTVIEMKFIMKQLTQYRLNLHKDLANE